ncbi:MAG: hypothetical protein ACK5YA_00600 [bacterium]|jgi:hypothetical protein
MKIVRAIKIAVMISCLIAVSHCVSSESSFKMNTHFKSLKKLGPGESAEIPVDKSLYAPKNLTAEDLPDMPIYYQAWIKYFHFQKIGSDKSKKPKFFFKNEAFLKQSESEKDIAKADQVRIIHYIYIYYIAIFLLVRKLYYTK